MGPNHMGSYRLKSAVGLPLFGRGALDPANRCRSGSLAINDHAGVEAQQRPAAGLCTRLGRDPEPGPALARVADWNNAVLREEVLGALARGWSPEQVCAVLERHHGRRVIGVESIYRFIHTQMRRHKDYRWRHYLPRRKSNRGFHGRRGGSPALLIAGRTAIAERPAEAGDRSQPGHWEGDLMLFAKYRPGHPHHPRAQFAAAAGGHAAGKSRKPRSQPSSPG